MERWLFILRLRLRSLFRRDRMEDDLADEVRYHIDERARELMAKGLSDRDARDAALRAFGGVEQRKEDCRDQRRVGFIEDLVRDIVYAGRMMRRSPGFTIVAVLSLAIAIGANTAIFSIVDLLVLRTLPVPNPERLVFLDTNTTISFSQFQALRERSTVFDGMSAIWTIDRSNLIVNPPGDTGAAQLDTGQIRIGLASADYFSTLGLTAAIGRTFASDEDLVQGGHPVAVISDAYWERRFGRAPDVVGRTLGLNSVTYDIIGVAPRGFTGEWVGMPTDMWVPFMMVSQVMPEIPGGPERFPRRVLARLKPEVTIEQARAVSQVLYQQILEDEAGAKLTPEWLEQISRTPFVVESAARGHSPQRRSFAQPIAILVVAVGLLLLIACANLANLLLARSAARQREIAVRLAIGASRGRLARQMLTESVVLAAAGAALGSLFAVWADNVLAGMVASAPVSMSGQASGLFLDLTLDRRAVIFSSVLCLLTGLLFGAAPARSSSGLAVSPALSRANARVIGSERRFGPSTLLVITQVALSLLLLIGAGLLVRTLNNLKSEELGFEREHLLLVWTVPGQTGRQDTALAALWHTVQERLSALPGVVSAGASNQAVLRGVDMPPGSPAVGLRIEGEPPKPSPFSGLRTFVTPGFFRALGVPIVAGRDFTERDTENSAPVVIINETMARFYFGDRPAVGRMVQFTGPKGPLTEIVGVVGDFAKGTPRGGIRSEFATYFPYQDREALNRGAQSRLRIMLVALRTAGDPLGVADRVRRELRAIDPTLPVLRINTVDEQLDDVLAQDRLLAALSIFFSATAVLLACLGLFGLVSYRVARRTNEIGVRLALGATRRAVLAMVLGESGRLVLVGVIIGLAGALATTRLIAARLFGIPATDPWTIGGAIALLLIVAGFAAYVPARRAARVDPAVALRSE